MFKKKELKVSVDYIEDFPSIDIDQVSKELKVEEKARASASIKVPNENTKDSGDDPNEAVIVNYFESMLQQANTIVQNKFAAFDVIKQNVKDAIMSIKGVKNTAKDFVNEVESEYKAIKSEHEIQKEHTLEAKRELKAFKQEHRITRSDRSSNYPMLNWIIVAFIVLMEIILNSNFFAISNEFGILGGIIQASVISLINAFLAYIFVQIIRMGNLNTISETVRKVYYGVATFIVLVTLHIHFLVGHYRDGLKIDPENAYFASIQNFSNNPWKLVDFNSYILVILGTIAFILLILDMYKVKDPYPGYSEVSKKFKTEKDKLDALQEDYTNVTSSLVNDLQEMLKSEGNSINQVYKEGDSVSTVKKKLSGSYSTYIEQLSTALNAVLQNYRAVNINTRTDENFKLPAYFNKKVNLSAELVKFDKDSDLEKSLSQLKDMLNGFAEVRSAIVEEYKGKKLT